MIHSVMENSEYSFIYQSKNQVFTKECDYMKTTKEKRVASLGDTIIHLIVFSVLIALPAVQIRMVLFAIPLYGTIMLLFRFSAVNGKKVTFPVALISGICFAFLIALYIYYLLPRQYDVNLGVATVPNFDIAKVLFVLSGVFALITIGIISKQLNFNMLHT